jgi:chromosome segregation ATPase
MGSKTIIYAIGAAVLGLLIWWGVVKGMAAYHSHKGSSQETISHNEDASANSHATAAQAIPDHVAELQAAEDRAKASEAKAARLLRERDELLAKLAAKPVPSTATADEVAARDAVIAKDKEVIEALQVSNADLSSQVGTLKVALSDKTLQYQEMYQAFQHEQKARLAQQAATDAWRSAVKEARTQGRLEGGGAVGTIWVVTKLLLK